MSIGIIAFWKIWGNKVEQYHTVQTDVEKIYIPKFDGSNYKNWSSKVEVALKAIGAWRIVTGELKDPEENASLEQQEAYWTLNNKGCALINNSLEKEVLESLGIMDTMTSCKEAWNLFQFTFSDASPESIFPQDILEDIREVNEFNEEDIKGWIVQRKKTIKTVEKWYGWLEFISITAKFGELALTFASLCANALNVLAFFYPQLSLMRRLMLFARFARKGGMYGTLGTKIVESVSSKEVLKKVRTAIEEDAEKSQRLGGMFVRMAHLDVRLKTDFDVGLWEYFLFMSQCVENPLCSVQGIKIFNKGINLNSEGSLEFVYTSFKFMRKSGLLKLAAEVGEASLVMSLGVGSRNRKLVLGSAAICLDLIDIYDKWYREKSPEYVTSVQTELEKLKKELKEIENSTVSLTVKKKFVGN